MTEATALGQYRTEPSRNRQAMVYVRGRGTPLYITEMAYRAKGYKPVFEKLPTEDEYDAGA